MPTSLRHCVDVDVRVETGRCAECRRCDDCREDRNDQQKYVDGRLCENSDGGRNESTVTRYNSNRQDLLGVVEATGEELASVEASKLNRVWEGDHVDDREMEIG